MKGQYLAVETILTVAMGISIAVGTITVFTDFQESTLETAERTQALSISSKILGNAQTLRTVESGRVDFTIPQTISQSEYVVEMDENLTIIGLEERYSFKTGISSLDLNGRARGGRVSLIKRGSEIELRARE